MNDKKIISVVRQASVGNRFSDFIPAFAGMTDKAGHMRSIVGIRFHRHKKLTLNAGTVH
jgi:hypothetical protein